MTQVPFIDTREMLNVLAIAKEFHMPPSQVVGLVTPIGRYCFDAASVLFLNYLADKRTPRFESDRIQNPGLKTLMG